MNYVNHGSVIYLDCLAWGYPDDINKVTTEQPSPPFMLHDRLEYLCRRIPIAPNHQMSPNRLQRCDGSPRHRARNCPTDQPLEVVIPNLNLELHGFLLPFIPQPHTFPRQRRLDNLRRDIRVPWSLRRRGARGGPGESNPHLLAHAGEQAGRRVEGLVEGPREVEPAIAIHTGRCYRREG